MLASTRPLSRGILRAFGILLAGAMLAGCGINTIPTLQERAKAAWSEVLNQYQRRADLIPKFFELGLMGIEVPEEFGGAGGGIFMSALAIEELARVDASAAIYVDVHNTLVNNAFLRWGTK